MPCFKGLAVSIHASEGPLPEYSIQKQTRASRINSYIPVPLPQIASSTNKAEPSTFAISITLLTPGLSVPYSTPKPTAEDPYPRPQIVGSLPGFGRERGRYTSSIGPYEPLTSSPNETIAAYIYFDGRQKEEVATLLRRGEETWVNSRWVGVPESEGGGLAEREFLFREVGLERWLNGLDLEGKDVQATIEKRRNKLEKKRQKWKSTPTASDEEDGPEQWQARRLKEESVLAYGADSSAPLRGVSDEEGLESSSEEDSDDDPIPEAAGQIKVALFRVIASGEIKKGEYSPQFDAHDDDDDSAQGGDTGEANVDHTTSFAKPKTLDPRSISTQTVTGLDGPEKPYAVFTFLYRGEKQLQKMGILKPKKSASNPAAATNSKRRSVQAGIESLGTLKTGESAKFTGIRETYSPPDKNGKIKLEDLDSDDEAKVNLDDKPNDADDEDVQTNLLSPEDAKKQGEIAEGVRKIRLKRQHSAEPPTPTDLSASITSASAKSPKVHNNNSPTDDSAPQLLPSATYDPSESKGLDPDLIGSPLKRQRASLTGADSELRRSSAETLARGLGFGYKGAVLKSVNSDLGADTNFGGALAKPAAAKDNVKESPDGGTAKETPKTADNEPPVTVKTEPEDEDGMKVGSEQ